MLLFWLIPRASHHQDYYMLSRDSYKTFICHYLEGGQVMVIYLSIVTIVSNLDTVHLKAISVLKAKKGVFDTTQAISKVLRLHFPLQNSYLQCGCLFGFHVFLTEFCGIIAES